MSRRTETEDGFVLAWFALMLTALMAFAGLAIDVSNWYFTGNRMQNAADAAALAGVIHMPGDFAGLATSGAVTIASNNGFAPDGDTQVIVERTPNPAQLKVTIVQRVRNFFGPVVGFDTLTMRRSAVAEFQSPLAMGSPDNTLGDEPVNTGVGNLRWGVGDQFPGYWLNVAGPTSNKQSGDRHQAGTCDASVTFCRGASLAATGKMNDDYAVDGYFFTVHVEENDAHKALGIELFDPAYVAVGDFCEAGWLPQAANDATLRSLVPDAAQRYAGGITDYCTGDISFDNAQPVSTTVLVRGPDGTPWTSTDNPILGGACAPRTFPAVVSNQLNALRTNPALRAQFRQWYSVCTIADAAAGDYIVQIRTNASTSNPAVYASTVTGAGHNRFAMRAALLAGGTAPDGDPVQVYAQGRLPIYGNDVFATSGRVRTSFHLTRVPSTARGRRLTLEFFDTGDAGFPAGETATMAITAPPDATTGAWTNCPVHYYSDGRSEIAPDCVVRGITSQDSDFQGKLLTLTVDIPAGYSCDDADPDGCWLKVAFDYPQGTRPNDTTTWSARLQGDPVRLVE